MLNTFLEPVQKLSPEVNSSLDASIAFVECIHDHSDFILLPSHAIECVYETTGGWLSCPVFVIRPLIFKEAF